MKAIQIHPTDNVAVALAPLPKGTCVEGVTLCEDIPQGHKFSLREIDAGAAIVKYGSPIGSATAAIAAGAWVHLKNIKTNLSEQGTYAYHPAVTPLTPRTPQTFLGYLRPDGRAGVRNEIWILPTVGCVNGIALQLAHAYQHLTQHDGIDAVVAFPHPYGCSQMGDDHRTTQQLLAALAKHPNAGGVLVVGLGCENNTIESFRATIGSPAQEERVQFLLCQEDGDEIERGGALLEQIAAQLAPMKREPLPVDKLVVGLKCGGSDGLSGITANPVVGAFSDLLIAEGGSTLLTEVPEMFGAEEGLLNRAVDQAVFDQAVAMIDDFKQYFVNHGQVVYENPSPGNKQGGISTLEDKSLGCVQKGGTAPVVDVIPYAGSVRKQGLTLLSAPGNDLVAATALAAAGAQIVLFTTGRGTPFGCPVPTLKISSNTDLATKKANWIDFDAGRVVQGDPISQVGADLLQLVLAVASGTPAKNEQLGYREIAIFKNGVTL